jgi:hypothetical protein
MTETNSPPIVSQQAQTLLRDQISTLTENAINEMQRVHKRAGRVPVYALLVLGAAMIIFALAFKVQFFGQAYSSLSPPEFITMILTGSLLVILGGVIHLYQYRLSQEIRKGIQAIAESALEATVEYSNKVIEAELQLRRDTVAKQNRSGRTS